MSVPARTSSFLPTIKCSSCNYDIPISRMGEHVCSEDPPLPTIHPNFMSSAERAAALIPPAFGANGRASPSVQDKAVERSGTNTISSVRLPFSSNSSTASSPRSTSPVESLGGRKSPYQLPARSQTTPLQDRSTPGDNTTQDTAFPHLQSQPADHARLQPAFDYNLSSSPPNEYSVEAPLSILDQPTLSSRSPHSGNMAKALNNISSGPFGIQMNKRSSRNSLLGHRKSSSASSLKDLARHSRTGSVISHTPRPSTSSSVYTRHRSASINSGTSRYTSFQGDVPAVPALPGQLEGRISPEKAGFDFSQPSRALTYPRDDVQAQDQSQAQQQERRPSESTFRVHKPRPSLAAAMQPLDSIGSTSTFKPSRSRARGLSISTNKTNADSSRDVKPLQEPPPIPSSFRKPDPESMSPFQTPRESTSSHGSFTSGAQTGSSRSSPPLQESPEQKKYLSENTQNSNPYAHDGSFNQFQFGISDPQSFAHMQSPDDAAGPTLPDVGSPHYPSISPRYSPFDSTTDISITPRYPSPSAPSPSLPPPENAQPTIPNIELHNPRTSSARPAPPNIELRDAPPASSPSPDPILSPVSSADDYLISPTGTQYLANNTNLRLSPAPSHTPPPPLSPGAFSSVSHNSGISEGQGGDRTASQTRKSPPSPMSRPNKGPCRGCGELITGKSITSADGRLTGRYHKGCFTCKTCQSPFQTADFYVLDNSPYCARHYHELNESLCAGCDRGIEGQYLETARWEKFHSYCFTCQECQRILRGEYFEWQGRRLCEMHAFRAAQQPSSALGMAAMGGMHSGASAGYGHGVMSGGAAGMASARGKFPERRTTKLMMM